MDFICPHECSYRTSSGYCGSTGGWERCQYRQLHQSNTVVGYVSPRKTTERTIKVKDCPLCGSPVTAKETLKAFGPPINPYGDKWYFNARFTAKCERCFCTLDAVDTYDDANLGIGEELAEDFFRTEERLWNREANDG